MEFLRNLQDKAAYAIYNATYDPAAEEYAASKRAAEEAAAAADKAAGNKEATNAAAEAEKQQKAAAAADLASRSQFNTKRFTGKVIGTTTTVLLIFAAIAGGVYGAHLATNLNIYRSWPYRLLYAIYGFVFFPVVILYVLGYRWWWQGKKPRFYALLPLIPYFINHPILAYLLSWMSYKPDDVIDAFQEWNPDMVKKAAAAQEDAYTEDASVLEREAAEAEKARY